MSLGALGHSTSCQRHGGGLPDPTVTKKNQLIQEPKMKNQLLMCVERRLAYACGIGKHGALSVDGADVVLQSSSDIFKGVRALSADIAAALYPLIQTSTESVEKVWNAWKAVRVDQVPAPVMLFLTEAFPTIDWCRVLRTLKGASPRDRLKPSSSWLSLDHARTHCKMGISCRDVQRQRIAPEWVSAQRRDVTHTPGARESAAATSSASPTGAGVKVRSNTWGDPAPKKLECHYRHSWITHSGWMSGIYLTNGKPHFRYVCPGCLKWLREETTVSFEMCPGLEEQNQIVLRERRARLGDALEQHNLDAVLAGSSRRGRASSARRGAAPRELSIVSVSSEADSEPSP